MIELHERDDLVLGRLLYINPANICFIGSSDKITDIGLVGGYLLGVDESANEILSKITKSTYSSCV